MADRERKLGLETTGVELDARGYIRVNERLETTAPDVWAIRECAGRRQFTHASVDDLRIIRDNLADGDRSTGDRLVPYCMFTDPCSRMWDRARTTRSAKASRRGLQSRR